MEPVIREKSILMLCCLIAVAMVTATGTHRHEASGVDGVSHVHSHGHHGAAHTHGHMHLPAGDDGDGDHHDLENANGDSIPMLLPNTQRVVRGSTPTEFVVLQLQSWLSVRPESPDLDLPDRPPRPPTNQDSLPQIRTIVLLT